MNKKTLFITTKGLIQLDENLEPTGYKSDREAVNNVVRIKEPMHIVYNKNEKRIELDAEEGDILISFYESTYPNPVILIHSKEWEENLIAYDKYNEELEKKWAAQRASQDCKKADCGDCLAEAIPDAQCEGSY